MLEINDRELNALVSLLDDTDSEVVDHVSQKLRSFGHEGIPVLKEIAEQNSNDLVRQRVNDIIADIQSEYLVRLLRQWIQTGGEDLLEAALIVAKVQYPDIEDHRIFSQVERIIQYIWINLNATLGPIEEIRAINKVLFAELGYKGNKEPEMEPDLAYLNTVLETHLGNSIGIGILYVIIAQALDLPVYGVNLPYHFIMAYTSKWLDEEKLKEGLFDDEVLFYINPLLDGVPFYKAEIERYLEKARINPDRIFFSPCNNISIIKTLVYNQMCCYEQKHQPDMEAKMRALYELFD